MSVRIAAAHPRGEEPFIETKAWLELRGTALEPVGGVSDVQLSMYPEDEPTIGTARPAAIGAIIRARPQLDLVLSWPQADFDRVSMLALTGKLTHARVTFTKPRYNSGLVVNASFSTELEE